MKLLQISQIIIAILLIVAILLQNRGSGLSGVFGGGDNVYSVKRGAEKVLFHATIILSVLFFGIAFLGLVLN